MSELLAGVKLLTQEKEEVDAEKYLDGKVAGLYFSASWCGPCRNFTPKLEQFYKQIKKTNPEFEVVFVSRDHDEKSLCDYFFDHMGNWVAIKFGDPKIKELLEKYNVKTIPSMRIIKPNGDVVAKEARNDIQENTLGDPLDVYERWLAFYD